MKKIKRCSNYVILNLIIISLLLINSFDNPVFAGKEASLKIGDYFPNIPLNINLSKEDIKYLGLTGKKEHYLKNIHTGFLLIELFSIYCPVCQTKAEKINILQRLIEKDGFLNNNLKLIGIGTGNNRDEIEYFKKYYKIAFPCISDHDFKIHKALHEPRTPMIVLIDKRTSFNQILYVFDINKEPDALLQDIRNEVQKRLLKK